ncbi:MAG: TIGR03087 family PEP-CTERM/XrtA system glycosyltransferase [Parasphingopyxis sp.]|nr:TIGR03087 family PEP-CTERM/XrtA system glycosyltransferase [Sphingomonadales bacterium]
MMGDILFLAHRVPFPPDRGDRIRSFHILKKLAELAPVHVATLAENDADMAAAGALGEWTATSHVVRRNISRPAAGLKALASGKPVLLPYFDSAELRHWVARTLDERPIDTVVAFSVQMAQFVPKLPAGVRFVMDFADVDSAKFAAYARTGPGPMRWVNAREARKLAGFERATAARADASLFVSEPEAALFRETVAPADARVEAIENGIDWRFFDPAADFPRVEGTGEGRLIVFTGQMDYRPNIEAVTHFVRDILPQIRAAHPDARFAIVGRAPTSEVERLARDPAVTVTGAVADIRGWLAAADLVVAPLLAARGIQNKVLEAMAMAKPVIASRPAFEGIDAEPDTHLLVAEDADDFAGQASRLLAAPDEAEALGTAARAHVRRRYDWATTLVPLAALTGRAQSRSAAA